MAWRCGAPLTRRAVLLAFVVLLSSSLVACGRRDGGDAGRTEATELLCASTTSVEDSGLFGELEPAFEAAYPQYDLKVVAVGTGEALQQGRDKDVDVLLVHAKADEERFVADGYGTERRDVMYNDFVIVGPEKDPSGVGGSTDVASAMRAIATAAAPFVSRGDDSGTHAKELELWAAASVVPTATGEWYEESGQGMGETLRIASEQQGYTLADRASFLAQRDTLDLVIVYEGDARLFNQYGVIPVTDAVNQEGARAFADWITSEEGQAIIGEFGVEEFGEPLFVPNAR